MATLNVSNSSYTVIGRKITINYVTDTILTNVQLSNDGIKFIDAIAFSQLSALFDISSWPNGDYPNCILKGTFDGLEVVVSITELIVNENETTTFTAHLNRAPENNESINIESNDEHIATVDKTSLIFTADNYYTPQTVTVTGLHDSDSDIDNMTNIVLSNSNMGNVIIPITVKNIDTFYGEIVTNISTLSVNENSTATFTVKLSKKPTNNQVVTLSLNNNNISINKTSLTFTPDNYNTPQTVTITGAYNGDINDKTCAITLNSSNVSSKTVNVTVKNIDVYGEIILNKTSLSIDEGNATSFTVQLNAQPTNNQTVNISLENNYITVDKTSLTFTPSNYNTPQTIIINGVHDENNYSNRNCNITLSSPYINNKMVSVTINNIDVAPETFGNIVINTTSLSVNENSTTSFTVRLDKQPTNNQTVNISLNNNNVSINKTSLTFTPDNYSVNQTVTVTGAHDNGYDNKSCIITLSSNGVNNKTINTIINNIDKHTYTVTNNLTNCVNSNSNTTITEGNSYNATISANSGYILDAITVTMGGTDITSSVVNGSNIAISNVTSDIIITATTIQIVYGEIMVNTTSLSVEEDSTTTFTVCLDKAPTNNQIVNISCENTNVSIDKNSLTFTPDNYNTSQTITVTGTHDSSNYSDKTCNITLSSNNVSNKVIAVAITNIDIEKTEVIIPTVLGFIGNDGELTNSGHTYVRSDYIKVNDYSKIILKTSAIKYEFDFIALYNSNKSKITISTANHYEYTLIIPSNCYYIAFDLHDAMDDYAEMTPSDVIVTMEFFY